MPKYEVEIELDTLETMLVYVDAPSPEDARQVIEGQLEEMEPDRHQIARHFQQEWEGAETAVSVEAVRRAHTPEARLFFAALAQAHRQMLEAWKKSKEGLDEPQRQHIALLLSDLSTLLDEWDTLSADKETPACE